MSNKEEETKWHSRYLHFWQTSIKQEKEAKIELYNNIQVKAKITGMDSQANRFCVQEMETPNSGWYEKAVLRGVDIKTIEILYYDWNIGTR